MPTPVQPPEEPAPLVPMISEEPPGQAEVEAPKPEAPPAPRARARSAVVVGGKQINGAELRSSGGTVVSLAPVQVEPTVTEWRARIDPGDYTITVNFEGRSPYQHPITIARGETKHLQCVFFKQTCSAVDASGE